MRLIASSDITGSSDIVIIIIGDEPRRSADTMSYLFSNAKTPEPQREEESETDERGGGRGQG